MFDAAGARARSVLLRRLRHRSFVVLAQEEVFVPPARELERSRAVPPDADPAAHGVRHRLHRALLADGVRADQEQRSRFPTQLRPRDLRHRRARALPVGEAPARVAVGGVQVQLADRTVVANQGVQLGVLADAPRGAEIARVQRDDVVFLELFARLDALPLLGVRSRVLVVRAATSTEMYRRRPGAVVGVQERDERVRAVRGLHLHGVVQSHRANQRRLHAHDVRQKRGGHGGAVDRGGAFEPGVQPARVVRVEVRQEIRHHVGALVVEPIDDEAGETTHALDRAELRRHRRPPRATTVARACRNDFIVKSSLFFRFQLSRRKRRTKRAGVDDAAASRARALPPCASRGAWRREAKN